ncbi:MAG: helix-turn-helix domain-containing protein [Anaerolineales bacterium]
MSGKKGMHHYPREVKLEAVRLFIEGGKTQAEIVEILGIRNVRQVKGWLHKFRQEGETAFEKKRRKGLVGRPPKKENREAYIARLEMENTLLKKFHAELRKGMLAKRNIGSSSDTEEHSS